MINSIYQKITENLENSNFMTSWLITVIKTSGSSPGKLGAKMLLSNDKKIIGTIGGGTIENLVIQKTLEQQPNETTVWAFDLSKIGMLCGGEQEVLIEPLFPSDILYIIGGGHCGKALAELAIKCGFNVTVIDERIDFANSNCVSYDEIDKHINFSPYTSIVVMTHSHTKDELVMRRILGKNYRYLGVIGSANKAKTMREKLIHDGFNSEELQKVFMPIGFNIGSETPYEIAISILAELIAVRKGRIHETKL
jgi:xanthine dehydrogenase accessory factor